MARVAVASVAVAAVAVDYVGERMDNLSMLFVVHIQYCLINVR